MRSDARIPIYTVVDVWRGLAVDARSFTSRARADEYLGELRRSKDLTEDDAELFESSLAIAFGPSNLTPSRS